MKDIYKIILIAIFITASCFCLSACAVKNSDITTFNEQDGNSAVKRHFDEYRVVCGDIFDIIYQIRPFIINSYKLKIQDVVEIRFPSMREHNFKQIIRTDGKITLPYINDLKIVSLTTEEATKKIRTAYKDIFRFPDAFLLLKEFGTGTKELKKVITTSSRGQSKLITVRPDGVITFPLIGDQFVAGLTFPEISTDINKKYQEVYPELQVDVILYKTAGTHIYVTGEVGRPGVYTINRPTTVRIALAMAGGATSKARTGDIIISRRKGEKMLCRIINLKDKKSDLITLLEPDDIIYVPKRRLSTAAEIASEISEVSFFRGYSVGFSWQLHSDEDD